MNTAMKVLGVIALALALGACGKKSSNSNTVATTPNNCTYNGYGGYVLTGTNTACTPTTTNVTCTLSSNGNGQYLNQYGQVCNPNQSNIPINNGGFGAGDGCSQYYYQYGVQYIPINMNGQMMCIRYDLVQGYYAQAGQQYYGQPIYSGYYGGQTGYYGTGGYYGPGYGQQQTSCINIGGQSWGSQYGINGNIGFCF